MPLARQTLGDFKGDNLSVKMFKNDDGSDVVDDWDTATETGTDNTTGIRSALSVLQPGQSLFFPFGGTGIYLITEPLVIPRRVTLRGADRIHCEIRYIGTSPQPAVLNLVGSEGVTIKHLAVMAWGDDPDKFPQTVLMLARTTDDHYGHHMFHECSFMGNTSVATIYSLASEENSWRSCNFYGNNGKGNAGTAHHIYYTSNKDDLGICPTAFAASNLDIWFLHCHFINFGPESSLNDCVYEQMYAGAGDHAYRDCYMSPSARGSTLGWGFRFVADPDLVYSGMNYVVEAVRMENGEGMFRLEKGPGPGIINGLRLSKNTLGISAGFFLYGEDGATLHESDIEQNYPPSEMGAVGFSVDKIQFTRVLEKYGQNFVVRTISAYNWWYVPSTLATLTLPPGSFNDWVILHDRSFVNGPLGLNEANAFINKTVALQVVGDPDDRSISLYKDGLNGIALLFHYDLAGDVRYGALITNDAATPLSLAGRELLLYAASGAGIAGQALTISVGKNITNVFGLLWIAATDLTLPGLLVKDADGETTGFSFTLQDFAGINYFSVYGATHSVNPGFLQSRDHIPFADNLHDSGNPGLLWKKIWAHALLLADLAADGPLRGVAGDVVYGPVDVGDAGDIAATGFSSGDLAEWDGSKFVPGSGGSTLPVSDATALVKGSGDASKLVRIEADGLTTATTRVATMPDRNIVFNQLDTLVAAASGSLTLTSSYADIAGDTVTLTANGKWLITATVKFTADAASGGVSAILVAVSTPFGADMSSDVVGTYTLTRTWLYTNSSGSIALKMQAKKTGGAGTSTAFSGSSDITAVFLG